MILALITAASAQPVGYYHPVDISSRSQVFAEASEQLSGPFEQRSGAIEQLATALQHYREALDLLGTEAPEGEVERLLDLQKGYHRQAASLQAFADVLIEDFDAAMRGAMDRAAATLGETQRCQGQIPDGGPRVPGMAARTKKNPECVGEDLNDAIVAAMDADTELKAAIDEVGKRPWPEVTFDEAPQEPVGGAERWLSVRDLMMAAARDSLRSLDRADDDARLAVEAALESDGADMAALKTQVDTIQAATAKSRADFAAPLLTVARVQMAKWKGEPATSWCANPRLLGGCTGTDASTELVGRLIDDKKFAKALP